MPLRPLAQSRADQRRFVDRAAETDALVGAAGAGQPALVLGEPGSGRSSLLHHVAWVISHGDEPRDPIIVTGEVARDPAQLLGVLVARVQRLARPQEPRGRWIDELRALTLPDGPFGAVAQPAILMELVDLLGESLDALPDPACLMIDGVAPAVAHGLFGTLRNELWALGSARWVVAGDIAAGALYREPPADAFFERTVVLEPLAPGPAAALVRAHMPRLPRADVAAAVAAGGGNPRRLLRAAADIAAGRAPAVAETDALARAAGEIAGPLAAAIVDHLAGHGPAAASDETLLARIGASRQRASQIMHELEAAGLLETLDGHEPGRRGRPARRFALRSPT